MDDLQSSRVPDEATDVAVGAVSSSDPHRRASDYVSRMMSLEGSGKDPRSTAVGGFLNDTWLSLMHQNLPQTAAMPDEQVLALRSDPQLRARMIAAYARDNAALLKMAGYEPDETNLRLSHWFGPAGAVRVLSADPQTPVEKIFPPDVIAANPILRGKSAGQVIDLSHQQMTGTTLRDQWTGNLSAEARALIDSIHAREEANHAENMSLLSIYEREAAAAPEGTKERLAAIDELRRVSHKMMQDWEAMAKKPPIEKPVDMWQNFGSAASIVALLGGLFARNHLTAGLAAAGEAMKAINTNNHELFQQAYKTWEQQTQLGLKMIDLQNTEIRQLLDDQKMAQDEKRARLSTLFQEYGMLHQDQTLRSGDDMKILQIQTGLEKAAGSARNMMDMIKMQNYAATLAAEKQAWLQKNPGKTEADIPANDLARMQTQAAGAAGIASASSARVLNEETFTDADVEFWANVLKNGGSLPPGLSRTAQGSILVQKIMKKMGESGDSKNFIANIASVKADARSLANMTKMADAATSFERTASLNFDLALKLSKDAVPTDWGPWLNRWVMTGETQFGDENVPPYVTAMLTGANEYAKIMSGSTGAQGSTVDSRREAAELFSPYLAKGQIARVVAVAKADMANRKASLYGQIDDIKARLRAAGSSEPTATQGQAKEPEKAAATYNSPDDVFKAVDSGALDKEQAKKILIDKFGFKPQ